MKYPVTERDKNLLLQMSLEYRIRITLTNESRNVIDVIYGTSDVGGMSVDSNSNIRRTFSFTLKLDDFINNIESKIASWIGLYYEVDIGIVDLRTDEIIYYPNGRFCITAASTSYDAVTNSLSLDLSDRFAELDGTRNGQIGGAPIISIPKEVNGVKQTLRGTTINLITSSTKIDKYIIDDIGEFYGMQQNNPDYADYRQKNDEWNILPYDLEYSCGNLIGDMLLEIRDLYPNCQMYFDVYDNFCFDMIPSLDNDIPDIDDDYLQKLLTSDSTESVSYNVSSIKNITEVFGKDYDIDYFSENTSFENNIYTLSLSDYISYTKYDMIAFKPTSDNLYSASLKINSLETIPIYYEYTDTPLNPSELKTGDMCVITIYKIEQNYIAYYLGKYQPHSLCVLTNDSNDVKYTKKYFSSIYNVAEKNVYFREEKHSPFAVQRLGEVLDVKSGDDFDNILSDSIAIENSKYYNRLSSTMFDTVTITTVLIPWLDVNVKINYRKQQEDTIYSYVVKSRSDNFSNKTSTITMYRFICLGENTRHFSGEMNRQRENIHMR